GAVPASTLARAAARPSATTPTPTATTPLSAFAWPWMPALGLRNGLAAFTPLLQPTGRPSGEWDTQRQSTPFLQLGSSGIALQPARSRDQPLATGSNALTLIGSISRPCVRVASPRSPGLLSSLYRTRQSGRASRLPLRGARPSTRLRPTYPARPNA